MKILIHTMYFLPEFGSAPILMNELAAFLSQAGHEVEVITTIPRPPHNRAYAGKFLAQETNQGFRIKRFLTNFTRHHIGRLIAWSIYTTMATVNLLTVGQGDVLFLRLPPLQLGVTGVIARRLRGARVLLNVQDIHPDLSIESRLLKNPFLIRMAKAFEKWIYDQTEEILVISEGFKKNLVAKGVPPGRIKILPNWVDTDVLKPLAKTNPVSRKYSVDDKFAVLYSGTISISSYRTLARVLEAAQALRHDPGIVFLIVGEGLKKNDLQSLAAGFNLPNVRFLPFQPYRDLPELMASADVLLVPLDTEKSQLSVPSKLYNCMAAGRPVLGLTNVDSEVFKIITETGCGACAPPDDPLKMAEEILALQRSPDLRTAMAARGRAFALEHFSREHVLKEFNKIISSKPSNSE